MFFLIEKKFDEFSKILYSCKDAKNKFSLVLKYYEEKKIKEVVENKDFKPWESGTGLYLVRDDKNTDEYIVYQVCNTGYLRDYFEFVKTTRVNIVEFKPTDKVDDSDTKTTVMKELLIKTPPIDIPKK
jgi:hypothetical protein